MATNPELDELVDDGIYRLRIDGQLYSPIDKGTLVALIESGVLFGHEEMAELDGPWMTVRKHPVLARLRAKMARELHQFFGGLAIAPHAVATSAVATSAAATGPASTGAGSPQHPATLAQRRLDLASLIEMGVVVAVILSLIVLFAILGLIISRAYF